MSTAADGFVFRSVEVRGVRYLRVEDVAAFLYCLGATEETDVRNRLDEAASLITRRSEAHREEFGTR